MQLGLFSPLSYSYKMTCKPIISWGRGTGATVVETLEIWALIPTQILSCLLLLRLLWRTSQEGVEWDRWEWTMMRRCRGHLWCLLCPREEKRRKIGSRIYTIYSAHEAMSHTLMWMSKHGGLRNAALVHCMFFIDRLTSSRESSEECI